MQQAKITYLKLHLQNLHTNLVSFYLKLHLQNLHTNLVSFT